MKEKQKILQIAICLVYIDAADLPSAPNLWPPESCAYEGLKNSIRKKGILTPIFVRSSSRRYRVVSGHYRFQVAKELGMKHIPCVEITNIDEAALWLFSEDVVVSLPE